MNLIRESGNLILFRAAFRKLRSIQSYAFDKFCMTIHNSLLFLRTSSIMILRILIGMLVLPSGNPAKLLSLKTLCFVIVKERRLVMTLTTNFLIVSNRIIGLVLVISYSQSYGLNIGYIWAYFH